MATAASLGTPSGREQPHVQLLAHAEAVEGDRHVAQHAGHRQGGEHRDEWRPRDAAEVHEPQIDEREREKVDDHEPGAIGHDAPLAQQQRHGEPQPLQSLPQARSPVRPNGDSQRCAPPVPTIARVMTAQTPTATAVTTRRRATNRADRAGTNHAAAAANAARLPRPSMRSTTTVATIVR